MRSSYPVATAVLALLLVASSCSAKPQAGYHPEQLEALNQLYQSTGGPSWVKSTEWTNDLYCLRYGITCDTQRNVIAISLVNNNLVGSIQSSLSQLPSLQTLDLSKNKLTGVIPFLYGMNELTYLNLSKNALSGPLPDLSKISGQILTMDLSHNLITGGLSGINTLASLVQLDISHNLLTDSINSVKLVWPRMMNLYLQKNLFRGNVNWLKSIPSIQHLDLSSNQFSGSFAPAASLNSTIKSCRADNNPFSCPVDNAIKCSHSCSVCASTYDSCDLCLDPKCAWCSTDSTGVNGVCVERGSSYACGGGFGFRSSSCARNCTAEPNACDNGRLPWRSTCSNDAMKRSLSTRCDSSSGLCVFAASEAACPQAGGYCQSGFCRCKACELRECMSGGCGQCLGSTECKYPDRPNYSVCCPPTQRCCTYGSQPCCNF